MAPFAVLLRVLLVAGLATFAHTPTLAPSIGHVQTCDAGELALCKGSHSEKALLDSLGALIAEQGLDQDGDDSVGNSAGRALAPVQTSGVAHSKGTLACPATPRSQRANLPTGPPLNA